MLTATDRVLCFGLHSLYRATTEMQYLLRHGDTSCLGWIGWIGVCELPPISGSYLSVESWCRRRPVTMQKEFVLCFY